MCWVIVSGPEAVSPDRALYSPTFSHLLIVNKTSLSLSLSPLPVATAAPSSQAESKGAVRLRQIGSGVLCA
jgi:hypothetical protein